MDLISPTTTYTSAAALVFMAAAFLLYQPTGLVRWLQKKNYQYEVTFALYMLTPTEKFIFNSILFLTFSLFTLAVILYLPDHVITISRRGYYYFAGDGTMREIPWQAAGRIGDGASKASEAVFDFAGTAYQAAVNTAVAAQEAVTESLGWE